MEKDKAGRGARFRRALGTALGVILSLGVLFALYVALVIAQPQRSAEEETRPQPLLTASPALKITDAGDLRRLAQSYPGPVMSFMSGNGMVFVSGEAEDVPCGGQFGRVLTLYWQTLEGQPLILRSIYPAEALGIMGKGDYTFSGIAGPTLFGLPSVRMENGENIRIHVQAEDRGLYVLILPKALRGDLAGIARSIQLFLPE